MGIPSIDEGHDQDAEGDRRRRAAAGQPPRQQPAQQERGPGELAVGEVAHARRTARRPWASSRTRC